jgi:uncharacterized surface protein with fasciclin (FAS1) repeats
LIASSSKRWKANGSACGRTSQRFRWEREIDTSSDVLNYVTSDTVTTVVRESIKSNGGHVIRANVNADNGILHVIDKVLIPAFTMF